MRKLFLFICLLFSFTLEVYAAYEVNVPISIKQPDGSIVQCYATGDEYYQRVHDANDFTLIRDSGTGFVVYAMLKGDELVSSGYRVGSVDPSSIGLAPGIDISPQKREAIRNTVLQSTPEKELLNIPQLAPTSNYGKNDGLINNIVVYIRFVDETEFPANGKTHEDMFNKDTIDRESLYSYYKAASYGRTLISSTFYPVSPGTTIISYRDIYPRSYYQPYSIANTNGYQGDNDGAERRMREHGMLKRAVEAVKNEIPSTLNLDFNNDGYVDNICFVVRGAADGWSSLLWPHRWSLYTYSGASAVTINNKVVWDYNLLLESGLRISTLAHEMFHTLGAPDLYRYTETSITPVGSWDVMASNTTPPQSSTAYIKYKYGGWIESIPEITTSGVYTLNNIWSATNNAYKISSPNSTSEFFVVEYRDRNVYWDSYIPGSGLIIYRVNTLVHGNSDGPPDEVYVFRPNGTSNLVNGSVSAAYFSSNAGRTVFNDLSNPPCFLSNNNSGGIHIRNISSSGGTTMSFEVVFSSYVISASANDGGTISPQGIITVVPGDNKTFTITPDAGKIIESVLVDGVNVLEAVDSGFYTFYNIETNHVISATFTCPPSNLPLQEDFNTAVFPADCWQNVSTSSSLWDKVTSGSNPTCSPYGGTGGMLRYFCWSYRKDETGLLITPKIATNNENCQLSFRMYRDNSGTYGNNQDKINIYLSATASIMGLAPDYTVYRCRNLAPIESSGDGWYQYMIDLPAASMSEAYIIIEGVSDYGNNIYLDDIKIITSGVTESTDATLSNLTVNQSSLSPAFASATTAYTVNVANNITSITLTATKNHSEAVVTGDGTKTGLAVGNNVFTITVTAEDGVTTKTYTVTVNRATKISDQTTAPATYCQNTVEASVADLSVTVSCTGPLTYQWYSATSASNSGGTLIDGAASGSYKPSTARSGVFYYYCVVAGDCGMDTSDVSGAITIKPLSTLSHFTKRDTSIYSGGSIDLNTLVNAVDITDPVFKWYINPTGLAALSSTTITLTTDTTCYVSVSGNNYCEGERDTVKVKIESSFTLKGTVFPFVHWGDPEIDELFTIRARLYEEDMNVTPQRMFNDIAQNKIVPIYDTLARFYNEKEEFVSGVPRYPGNVSKFNNPGEPIDWEKIGKTVGEVDNTLLTEGDTLETAIGLYTFRNVEPGNYILALSRDGFLIRMGKITVSQDGYLGHRELIPGDADGNQQITVVDVSMTTAMMSSIADLKYNPRYDYDGNLKIDVMDVSIVKIFLNANTRLYRETFQWLNSR